MKNKVKTLASILTLSAISMSAMNISPALNSISLAYPQISQETIQLLIGLPSLTAIISTLCAAWLSRKLSRKTVLVTAVSVFSIIGCLPMFIDGFLFLVFTRAVVGLCIGFLLPIITAITCENFKEQSQRNMVIGWQSGASAFGSVIATSLAGIFTSINYRLAFSVHLIGIIPLFIAILFISKGTNLIADHEAPGEPSHLRDRSLLHLLKSTALWLSVMFLFMTFTNCFATNLSLLIEGLGIGTATDSGLGISLFTIGTFCTGVVFGRVVQYVKVFTVNIGMLFVSIALLTISLAKSVVIIFFASILGGAGLALVVPYITIRIIEKAAPEQITNAVAFNNAVCNLGLCLTPYMVQLLTLPLIEKSTSTKYLISALLVFLLGFIIFVINIIKAQKVEVCWKHSYLDL